jgi:uncharacterized protein
MTEDDPLYGPPPYRSGGQSADGPAGRPSKAGLPGPEADAGPPEPGSEQQPEQPPEKLPEQLPVPPAPYGAPGGHPTAGYPPPGYGAPGYAAPPPGYPQPGGYGLPPSYPVATPRVPGPPAPSGWPVPPPLQPPAQPAPPAHPVAAARPAFPHPEPRPYHLMLRTWSYAWWRPVVGLFALVAGMLIIVPVALLPLLLVAAAVDGGGSEIGKAFSGLSGGGELTPSGLLYLNLTLAGLILWTWLLIRVLHSMRPRWLSSVRPKLRWPYLFACLGLAVVALVAQLVVGSLVPGDVPGTDAADPNPVDGRTIALLVIVLLTTPLQAAGEEYAFRGYLLQALGALLRNRWVTIVLTALLFATAHLQFDPPLFLDRFLFGLIAAWLVIRTGGLEAGIALHVLNNYLALGFAVFFADLTEALDPGDVSWWNLPVSLTQSLVYAALAAWVAGRMGLQTRTRPPVEAAPSPVDPSDEVTLQKVG